MRATEDILRVWKRFDHFPLETLTNFWYATENPERLQRSVPLMREHRALYNSSGNCFDLAMWLVDEFRSEGIPAYAIGHDLFTPDAHVAVVAVNYESKRFFCDLGDQWIQPILLENHEQVEVLSGFFPAAKIKLAVDSSDLQVKYIRPNGKVSQQIFSLEPISDDILIAAGEYSQKICNELLIEKRIFDGEEVLHWEYCNTDSFYSTDDGLSYEPVLSDMDEWITRIESHTQIAPLIIRSAFESKRELWIQETGTPLKG